MLNFRGFPKLVRELYDAKLVTVQDVNNLFCNTLYLLEQEKKSTEVLSNLSEYVTCEPSKFQKHFEFHENKTKIYRDLILNIGLEKFKEIVGEDPIIYFKNNVGHIEEVIERCKMYLKYPSVLWFRSIVSSHHLMMIVDPKKIDLLASDLEFVYPTHLSDTTFESKQKYLIDYLLSRTSEEKNTFLDLIRKRGFVTQFNNPSEFYDLNMNEQKMVFFPLFVPGNKEFNSLLLMDDLMNKQILKFVPNLEFDVVTGMKMIFAFGTPNKFELLDVEKYSTKNGIEFLTEKSNVRLNFDELLNVIGLIKRYFPKYTCELFHKITEFEESNEVEREVKEDIDHKVETQNKSVNKSYDQSVPSVMKVPISHMNPFEDPSVKVKNDETEYLNEVMNFIFELRGYKGKKVNILEPQTMEGCPFSTSKSVVLDDETFKELVVKEISRCWNDTQYMYKNIKTTPSYQLILMDLLNNKSRMLELTTIVGNWIIDYIENKYCVFIDFGFRS